VPEFYKDYLPYIRIKIARFANQKINLMGYFSTQSTLTHHWIYLFNRRWWNRISHFYAFFTLPNIGSPIHFNGPCGMSLKEENIFTMSEPERREFLSFCYPEDMPDRFKEIKYDRQYWAHTTLLIVRDDDGQIIGCVQLVHKINATKLPVEYAAMAEGAARTDRLFSTEPLIGNHHAVEIYRLRRSFEVDAHKAPMLITMLFKAIWAKTIQSQIRYLFLSFDIQSMELGNLYKRRLDFEDTGARIHYPGCKRTWMVLCKDCLKHEMEYATMSPKNFFFQTYCRANLKRKRYPIAA
jgi:hypothetical protein